MMGSSIPSGKCSDQSQQTPPPAAGSKTIHRTRMRVVMVENQTARIA
jgi:hypothetical protein